MAFKAKEKGKRRNHNTEEAIAEVKKESIKGFHVQLPASLHTALKIKASSNGENMKNIVTRLITNYVEK